MPLTKDYTYDFFISYSHIDNEEPNPKSTGWVEKFYNELNVALRRSIGTRQISIWWDKKRLSGNIVFDDEISSAVENTAVLICLNSPSFLNSDYCKKEVECFIEKASADKLGLKIKNQSRIFNLRLFNIPPNEYRKELSDTLGFNFYTTEDEAKLGDRVAIRSKVFKGELQRLRDSIIALVDQFPQEADETPLPSPSEFAIYFGDVADSLTDDKDRTINDLRKDGYKVYSDIPPPFEAAEHEKAATEILESSSLNVHMFDGIRGRKISSDIPIGYPQKQMELSLKIERPKLIWVPEELNIATIEEQRYREFLQDLDSGKNITEGMSYIRGKKSRLKQQIVDLAESLKEKRLQKEPAGYSALLDIHYEDTFFINNLLGSFFKEDIQTFLNPQQGDPLINIQTLKDCIMKVKNLVFFYSQHSRDWVRERFIAARQYIIDSNFPVKGFLFFLLPPQEQPDKIAMEFHVPVNDVIDNSFSPELQSQAMQQLVERIKARK
jgi:TIR domain